MTWLYHSVRHIPKGLSMLLGRHCSAIFITALVTVAGERIYPYVHKLTMGSQNVQPTHNGMSLHLKEKK